MGENNDANIMFYALDRLARLGNGELFGNSDGNIIAQKAISQVSYERCYRCDNLKDRFTICPNGKHGEPCSGNQIQ